MIKYVLHNDIESLIAFADGTLFDFTLDTLGLLGATNFDKKWLYSKLLFTQRNKFNGKSLHIAPILGDKDIKKFIDENIKFFGEIIISDFFGETVDKDSDMPILFPLYLSWYRNYTNKIYTYDIQSNSLIPYQ